MNGSEINDRLRRLQDICLEARENIADIEEYVKANNEYSQTSVSVLELPKKHFRTRFLNTCSCLDIKTIQDLIDCGRNQMRYSRNLGDETLNAVSDAMLRQFGIKW